MSKNLFNISRCRCFAQSVHAAMQEGLLVPSSDEKTMENERSFIVFFLAQSAECYQQNDDDGQMPDPFFLFLSVG